jgi:hypothetical protein
LKNGFLQQRLSAAASKVPVNKKPGSVRRSADFAVPGKPQGPILHRMSRPYPA